MKRKSNYDQDIRKTKKEKRKREKKERKRERKSASVYVCVKDRNEWIAKWRKKGCERWCITNTQLYIRKEKKSYNNTKCFLLNTIGKIFFSRQQDIKKRKDTNNVCIIYLSKAILLIFILSIILKIYLYDNPLSLSLSSNVASTIIYLLTYVG